MIETTASCLEIPPALHSQGANVTRDGVRYQTWCKHDSVDVIVRPKGGSSTRTLRLESQGNGYHAVVDEAGSAGDLYQYRFGESQLWPDPVSRYQPSGVHGASAVIDPGAYRWNDQKWQRPRFDDLIIYELHVGAFTREGTFQSAIDRLGHLAALGVTAIELMPLSDFPGERNWGYDGVMLYAPARAYGAPDDLRALVDAAHASGLAVILDVVYNHFGPDGNYTGVYHDGYYSDAKRETPWGRALDYAAGPVRALFVENAPYWMREFHIDGFRLDATHTIEDNSRLHILAEIAETVHALKGFIIAEDERNEPKLLTAPERGGWGFDGVWADDFHHVARVGLTQERESYYANFEGSSAELAQTLTHGWLYRGQAQKTSGEPRGGDSGTLAPPQFIYCISNHDQVGNRAFGERLNHVVSEAAYRAASALLCLVPQTPMMFMGQEWGASTPFQFFTDHEQELGEKIAQGRRREFEGFGAFRDLELVQQIPNPQARETFINSKIRWEEIERPQHAGLLLLYTEFLQLRREHPAFRLRSRESYVSIELSGGIVAVLYGESGVFSLAVITDLQGGHAMPDLDDDRLAPGAGRDWKPLLSSNEARFGGDDSAPFSQPITMVFEAV